MQFLQADLLWHEVFADRFSNTCFRRIGRCDPDRTHQATIQIMQHMPLVPIYTNTSTFSSMSHLCIFNANTSLFGNLFSQCLCPILLLFNILPLHLMCYV